MAGQNKGDISGGILLLGVMFLIYALIVSQTHDKLNAGWIKAIECTECNFTYRPETYKKDFCEHCGHSGNWNKPILLKCSISYNDVFWFHTNKVKIEKKYIDENPSKKEAH